MSRSILVCLLLAMSLTGCKNAGPEDWTRVSGEGAYSIVPFQSEGLAIEGATGYCVLDGSLLLGKTDAQGQRSFESISGKPHDRVHRRVWNTGALWRGTARIGNCFEQLEPCEWDEIFLLEGKAIVCNGEVGALYNMEEALPKSHYILPYTAPNDIVPRVCLNGSTYEAESRHRTGRVRLYPEGKAANPEACLSFRFGKPASMEAFAVTEARDGSGKRFYFHLMTYYPARHYFLVCDESLKTLYFTPLDEERGFSGDAYFLVDEPSLSENILLVSTDFFEGPVRVYEILEGATPKHVDTIEITRRRPERK